MPVSHSHAADIAIIAEASSTYMQILDVGCGPGDNAIYLASKGYQVTALDLSQHALDRCCLPACS